ncbi:hypothetical protein RQP46_004580 [Phenoliferia psychrophenolica]
MSDSFFALHRPLLELPIRLSARKTVAPQPRLWERQDELDEASEELRAAEAEREEIEACARAVDRATGSPRATPTALATAEAETVQLVDLAEDGVTIVGEFYLATIDPSSATTLAEVREEVEETTEDELEFADLDRQATEAAHDDIANGLPDPYEPWLIGTHELDTPTNAAVSRYLAQHPPFVAPAPPSPSLLLALAPTRPAKSSTSWPSHVQSDISFLRPFPAPSASATANAAATVPTNPAFASHFLDPLPSGLASQVADQFLSSAILAHRFNAHLDYATHSGEALELARRAYADPANGPLPPRRRAFDEKRQRGEVRLWNEEDGWVTVDLGKGRGAGSPFLPAEMVDLDWEDDKMERLASLDGIRMDSVKRKRKKKITKHKFKKRRSMATIQSLAVEILEAVFALAHDVRRPSTMCSASLVCRFWQGPAQRVLFEHLALGGIPIRAEIPDPEDEITTHEWPTTEPRRDHKATTRDRGTEEIMWCIYGSRRMHLPRSVDIVGDDSEPDSRRPMIKRGAKELWWCDGVRRITLDSVSLDMNIVEDAGLRNLEGLTLINAKLGRDNVDFSHSPSWPPNLKALSVIRSGLIFRHLISHSTSLSPVSRLHLDLDLRNPDDRDLLMGDELDLHHRIRKALRPTLAECSFAVHGYIMPMHLSGFRNLLQSLPSLKHLILNLIESDRQRLPSLITGYLPTSISRLTIAREYPAAGVKGHLDSQSLPFAGILGLVSELLNLRRLDFPDCKTSDRLNWPLHKPVCALRDQSNRNLEEYSLAMPSMAAMLQDFEENEYKLFPDIMVAARSAFLIGKPDERNSTTILTLQFQWYPHKTNPRRRFFLARVTHLPLAQMLEIWEPDPHVTSLLTDPLPPCPPGMIEWRTLIRLSNTTTGKSKTIMIPHSVSRGSYNTYITASGRAIDEDWMANLKRGLSRPGMRSWRDLELENSIITEGFARMKAIIFDSPCVTRAMAEEDFAELQKLDRERGGRGD